MLWVDLPSSGLTALRWVGSFVNVRGEREILSGKLNVVDWEYL